MPSKVWYTNVSYGFCLVCIFAYAILRRNKANKPDEDEECHDIFVPTYEWQVVKKGQVVPEGLYVRMNFETGITEAKLINETPDYVTRNMESCNNNNEANQPIFSLSELQTYLTRRN